MRWGVLAAIAALGTAPPPASPVGGECRLEPRLAVVCSLPLNAARVWNAYGHDPKAFDPDYVQVSLRKAGCYPLEAYTDYRGLPIRTARRGRIATPSGWVPVTEIVRWNAGRDNAVGGFIADAYLRGDCLPDKGFRSDGSLIPEVG